MGAVEKSLIPKGKKYDSLSRKDQLAVRNEIQNINDQTEVNAIINKFIQDKILKEEADTMQKTIDDNSKNRGGMPKKDFAKPGSYSSAYNKGGMGKAKTGHTDYRKGGMVYGSKK